LSTSSSDSAGYCSGRGGTTGIPSGGSESSSRGSLAVYPACLCCYSAWETRFSAAPHNTTWSGPHCFFPLTPTTQAGGLLPCSAVCAVESHSASSSTNQWSSHSRSSHFAATLTQDLPPPGQLL